MTFGCFARSSSADRLAAGVSKSGRALVCFLLAGCGGGRIGDLPVQWQDLPLGPMLGQISLWIFLGVVVGLVAAPSLFFLLRRWGAYRLDGKLGWWLRLVVAVFLFVSLPLLGGAVGFWEGMIRAADVGVRESPVGKDLLPRAGDVCADGLLFVDGCLGGPAEAKDLDVQAFLGRLDGMQEQLAAKLSDKFMDQWRAQHPEVKGTALEAWAEFVAPRLAKSLIERKLQKQLDDFGMHHLEEELRREAARREGRPMERAELGSLIADRVLLPGVLRTLNGWLRGPQKLLLMLAVAAVLLPVAVFWVLRRTTAGRAAP